MDEKIKTWTLHFSTKENPNVDKALFNKIGQLLANFVAVWHQSEVSIDF